MIVLALNGGSTSLKFGLFRVGADLRETLITGEATAMGQEDGAFHASDSAGAVLADEKCSTDAQGAVARIKALIGPEDEPVFQGFLGGILDRKSVV